MKKYTAAFIITVVLFSVALQFLFSFYVIKTSDLSRFMFIRKKIERNARLSAGMADYFMDFKKGPSTAVLALPSCAPNKTLIPGKFDFFIMHTDNNTSIFSLYPSPSSSRQHKSFYIKNIHGLEYYYSGSLFSFKCGINGTAYGRSFFIDPRCMLLPSELGVF